MTFPIIVRIPQRVLLTCYKTSPRPLWEFRPYWSCLCGLFVMIVFILTTAVYHARKLFDDVNKKQNV